MDQSTFDTFARRASNLLDRRSLVGGVSAAALAAVGLPANAGAKKHRHKRRRNKKSDACKKRVKDCRGEAACEPDCPDVVRNCCKKACKSVEAARECIEENT